MSNQNYQAILENGNLLKLPDDVRENLETNGVNRVVLTRGLNNSIYLYSDTEFQEIGNRLMGLKLKEEDRNDFFNSFVSMGRYEDLHEGRVAIPIDLMHHSGITEIVTIRNEGSRFEICNVKPIEG